MVLGERGLSWERVFVLVESSCPGRESVVLGVGERSWSWERGWSWEGVVVLGESGVVLGEREVVMGENGLS